MNREIRFQALRKNNSEWVYGYYSPVKLPVVGTIGHFINEGGYQAVEIEIKTLGQFSGKRDDEGQDLYEGDLVKIINDPEEFDADHMEGVGLVYFSKEQLTFQLMRKDKTPMSLTWGGTASTKKIGNIHQYPELYK